MFLISVILLVLFKTSSQQTTMSLRPITQKIFMDSIYLFQVFTLTGFKKGDILTLDFTDSQITTKQSQLTTCYQQKVDGTQLQLTNCNCLSTKCQAQLVQDTDKIGIVSIYVGLLVNPPYVQSQTVKGQFTGQGQQIITINQDQYLPGDLKLVSFIQTSQKVSEFNDYTINLQLNHEIPKLGLISVYVPQDTSASEMILSQSPQCDIQVYQQTKQENVKITMSSNNMGFTIDNTNTFLQQKIPIDTQNHISIVIKKVRNPSQLIKAQTSIQIQTLTSTSKLIDQISTGISGQSTQPGVFQFIKIESSNYVVGQTTLLNFQLKPGQFLIGGKLEIVIPQEFTLKAPSCIHKMGLSPDTIQGFCLQDQYKTFYTKQYYYPSTLTNIKMEITNVINPYSTKQTQSFIFNTYDAQGQKLCSNIELQNFYQATKSTLTVTQYPVRSNIEGDRDTTYTFEFTLSTRIDRNGMIRATFLKQYFVFGSSFQCYNIDSNNNNQKTIISSCQKIAEDASSYTIEFQETCSKPIETYCVANTKMKIEITGIKNPIYVPANSDNNEIILSSYTKKDSQNKDYLVDQGSTKNIPMLVPQQFGGLKFNRTGSNVAGQTTKWQIEMSSLKYLNLQTDDGNMVFFFPRNTICKAIDNSVQKCQIMTSSAFYIDCTVKLYTQTSQQILDEPCQSIAEVKIPNVCKNSAQCTQIVGQKGELRVDIENVRNYLDIGDIQVSDTSLFAVRLLNTQDTMYLQYSKSLNNIYSKLVISQLTSFTEQLNSYVTGQISEYTHTIKTNQEFPNTGYYLITMPSQIVVQNDCQCSAKINSLAGSCQIIAGKNQIKFGFESLFSSNQIDRSTFIAQTTQIVVKSDKIKNTMNTKKVDNIVLSSYTKQNNQMQQNTLSETLTTAHSFSEFSITRSNSVIQQKTNLIVKYKIFNNADSANDYLLLTLQYDQLIIYGLNTVQIEQEKPIKQSITYTVYKQTDNIVQFKIIMKYCPCQSQSTEYQFKISGELYNPFSTRIVASKNKLETMTSENYLIDASEVSILPNLQAGTLKITVSNDLQANNKLSYQNIKYTFQVIPEYFVSPKGYFQFSFVDNLVYYGGSSNLKVYYHKTKAELSSSTTILYTNSNNNVQFVKNIKVIGICEPYGCLPNVELKFDIYDNLKTFYSTKSITSFQNVGLSSFDQNDSLIDGGSIQAVHFNANKPNYIQGSTITMNRDSTVPGNTAINLDFQIQLNYIIEKESILRITFKNEQIQLIDQNIANIPKCYIYQNGVLQTTAYQCPIISNSNLEFTIDIKEFCSNNKNQCLTNSVLKFRMNNIQNGYYVDPAKTGYLQIVIYKNNIDQEQYQKLELSQKVRISQELLISSFKNIKMMFDNYITGQSSYLLIQFQLVSPLPTQSIIKIQLDPNFYIYQIQECQVSYNQQLTDSQLILQNTDCKVSIKLGPDGFNYFTELEFSKVCSELSKCHINKYIILKVRGLNRLYVSGHPGNMQLETFTQNRLSISQQVYKLDQIDMFNPLVVDDIEIIRSNNMIGQSLGLTLKMKVNQYLIKNQLITVTIPSSEIQVDPAKSASTIKCLMTKPIVLDLPCQLTTDSNSNIIISFQQTFCQSSNNIPQNCNPQKQVEILFGQKVFKNPLKKKGIVFDSNVLQYPQVKGYYDKQSQTTFESKKVLRIYPLFDFPALREVIIQRTNGLIQQTTIQMYIQFKISIALDSSNKILIQFPEKTVYSQSYSADKKVTVKKIKDMLSKQQQDDISSNIQYLMKKDEQNNYYLEYILISNYCSSGCPKDSYINFMIDMFANPQYLETGVNSVDYLIYTMDSQYYIMEYALVNSVFVIDLVRAFPIADTKADRTVYTPDQQTALTLQFKNKIFKIEKQSYMTFVIPRSQFERYSDQQQISSKDLKNNKTLNNLFFSQNSTHLNITVQEFCSQYYGNQDCDMNIEFSIQIDGLKNAKYNPSPVYANKLKIIITKNYRQILAYTDNIAITSPIRAKNELKIISMQSTNYIAGQDIQKTFQFQLSSQSLDSKAIIQIQFPKFTYYEPTSKDCKCTSRNKKIACSYKNNQDLLQKRLLYKYIEYVELTDFCSDQSYCVSNRLMDIQINLRNQISTYDYWTSQSLFVAIMDQSGIQQYQGSIQISANNFPQTPISTNVFYNFVQISSINKVYAQNVDGCFKYQMKNTFSSFQYQGKMVIQLNEGLLIQPSLKFNASFTNLKEIQISPTYDPTTKQLTLQYFNSEVDLSYQQVQFCMLGMTNPSSNKRIPIEVRTQEYLIDYLKTTQIDKSQNIVSYQSIDLANITVNKFERTVLDMKKNTQLNIEFVVHTPVKKTNYFYIEIDKSNQIQFNDQLQLQCSPYKCSKDSTGIKFIDICQSDCANNTQFTIQVSLGLKNVNYIMTNQNLIAGNYYFQIVVKESDNSLSSANSTIIASPEMKPSPMQLVSTARLMNNVFEQTVLSLTFQSNGDLSMNQIYRLSLPSNFITLDLIGNKSVSCYVKSNSLNYLEYSGVSCSNTIYNNSNRQEIKYIDISKICKKQQCSGPIQAEFKIENIRNVGYYQIVNSSSNIDLGIMEQQVANKLNYGVTEMLSINQLSQYKQLQKVGLSLAYIYSKDPSPAAKSRLFFRVDMGTGVYKNSVLKIRWDSNINITDQMKVRMIAPDEIECSFQIKDQLMSISNIFSYNRQQMNMVFIVDDFVNPSIANDYNGPQIEVTIDGLITSDNQLQTNIPKISIYTSQKCNSNVFCKKCGKSGIDCIECYNPSSRPILDYDNRVCLDRCVGNYYMIEVKSYKQGVLSHYQCQKCHSSCKTCFNGQKNGCLECGYGLVFKNGQCVDPSQCFGQDSVNLNYQCAQKNNTNCNLSCKTCGTDPNFCYSCKNGYIFDGPVGKCLKDQTNTTCTLENYYVDNKLQVCKKCTPHCRSCTSEYQCTSCNSYFGSYYQLNGRCITKCPTKYYSNSKFQCVACSQSCDLCSSGQKCLLCSQGYKLNVDNDQCQQKCAEGYFEQSIPLSKTNQAKYGRQNIDMCRKYKCSNYRCYDCKEYNPSVCTKCNVMTGYVILNNNDCKKDDDVCTDLKQVYNTQTNTCQNCGLQNCANCNITLENQIVQCSNCSLNYYLFQGYCYKDCPPSYNQSYYRPIYQQNYHPQCLYSDCRNETCQFCDQFTKLCEQCKPQYVIYNHTCYHRCSEYFYTKIDIQRGVYCEPIPNNISPLVIIYWLLAFIALVFLIGNKLNQFNKFNFLNGLIVFANTTETMGRFLVFCFLFYYDNLHWILSSIIFISFGANFSLGIIFSTLYLNLFKQNLRYFKSYYSDNQKYFDIVQINVSIFGIFSAELFQSGVLKQPIGNFYKVKAYRMSIIRIQKLALVIDLITLICYLVIIGSSIGNVVTVNEFLTASTAAVLLVVLFVSYVLLKKLENRKITKQQEKQAIKQEKQMIKDISDNDNQQLIDQTDQQLIDQTDQHQQQQHVNHNQQHKQEIENIEQSNQEIENIEQSNQEIENIEQSNNQEIEDQKQEVDDIEQQEQEQEVDDTLQQNDKNIDEIELQIDDVDLQIDQNDDEQEQMVDMYSDEIDDQEEQQLELDNKNKIIGELQNKQINQKNQDQYLKQVQYHKSIPQQKHVVKQNKMEQQIQKNIEDDQNITDDEIFNFDSINVNDNNQIQQSNGQINQQSSGQINQQSVGQMNQQSIGNINQQSIGQINQQSVGQINQQSIGQINHQSIGQINQQSIGQINQQSIGQINQQSIGQINQQSIGQINQQSIGQINHQSIYQANQQSMEQINQQSNGQINQQSNGQINHQQLTEQINQQSMGQINQQSGEQMNEERKKEEKVDDVEIIDD